MQKMGTRLKAFNSPNSVRLKMAVDGDDGKVLPAAVTPSLRLSYLPFQAVAETTRFLLRHGNVPCTDEVVWGNVFAGRRARGDYPFDKVPVMYINGTVVA